MSHQPRSVRRRKFLRRVGTGAAAVLTAGTALGYPVNETIRIGCLGTGGRCRHALMPNVKAIPGVRITAVCDVWDVHLDEARKLADDGALATKDYRQVLERGDIDAVIIGSPGHWHVPMTIDACNAQKDVYVEKPLTHSLAEGKEVIEAQNRNARIVQVGMQQRSMPQFLEAAKIAASGELGTIHKVHLTWNRNALIGGKRKYGIDPRSVDWKKFLGNAPEQPFDEYRFRNWRWFWDFGGGILTDLMVHYIDVANWFCKADHPRTAMTIGDHFRAAGAWETPDTIQTLLRYPDRQLQIYFEGTFVNARNAAMLEFMGTKATLYLDRGRYEVHPEGDDVKYREMVLDSGRKRGADFFQQVNGALLHLTDWIECVRSRKKPRAPAEAGVSAVTGAHLGNIAYRTGQVARWGET